MVLPYIFFLNFEKSIKGTKVKIFLKSSPFLESGYATDQMANFIFLVFRFILRANLASSPFWRTLLSRGYFSDGVFIVIIEGALLTVILRMPTLKELAFMALQRASAKPQISTRYYDRLHSPLDYNGISEVALKNILHMNNSLPLIPRIS